MLGVHPAVGGLPGAPGTAILSDRFWRKRFNADPVVIGRTIELNGHAFTIVGVTAPDFHGTTVELNPDLRVLAKTVTKLFGDSFYALILVGRLKPSVHRSRRGANPSVSISIGPKDYPKAPGKTPIPSGKNV